MTFEILPILTFFFLILFVTIIGSFFFKKSFFLGNLFLLANQITLFFKMSQFDEITFTKNLILNGLNLKFTLLILFFSILVMLLQNFDKLLGFKKNIVIIFMFVGVATAIGARDPLLFFLAAEITSCSISFYIATSGKDLSSLGALRNYIKSGFSGGVFLLFSYFLFMGTQKFSF